MDACHGSRGAAAMRARGVVIKVRCRLEVTCSACRSGGGRAEHDGGAAELQVVCCRRGVGVVRDDAKGLQSTDECF